MASNPSETTLANAALTLLGERHIGSLNDETKTARIISSQFAETRDELLRSHSWNFATDRVEIAVDATAPAWGYSNSYTLPADCLAIRGVQDDSSIGWTVEGRKILTDIGTPLRLVYTKRVTDPMQMDVMFRRLFAIQLAIDVEEAITGSLEKRTALERKLLERRSRGTAVDGQEPSPREYEASEFLEARGRAGTIRPTPTGTGTPL